MSDPLLSSIKCGNFRLGAHDNCPNDAETLVCAKCLSYYYCGRQCQIEHWKLHKRTCKELNKRRLNSLLLSSPTGNNNGGPTSVSVRVEVVAGLTTRNSSEKQDKYNKSKGNTGNGHGDIQNVNRSLSSTTESAGHSRSVKVDIFSQTKPKHKRSEVTWEQLRRIWAHAVSDFKADNNPSALKLYMEALAIAEELLGESHDVCAELHIGLGHTYMAMCTFPEAEEMYLKSIRMIEDNLRTASLRSCSRDSGGGSSDDSERSRSASLPTTSTSAAAAASLKSSDEMLAQLSRALEGIASLFIKEDRMDEAEPICQRAINLLEKLYGDTSPALTRALMVMAELHHWNGSYDQAVSELERAYECVTTAYGPVHPDVQKVTTELVEALRAQGDLDRAEHYAQVNYCNLCEFGEAMTDQLEIAEGAFSLAGVYKDIGRLAESEELLLSSLATFENLVGPSHGKVAGCLDSLANVRLDQGNTGPETESLYKRALSIFESVHGTGCSINASTILQNLGVLQFNRGKLQLAESYVKASLRMKESLQGTQHPDLSHIKANLAYIYGFQGRVTEAISLYEDALETLVRLHGQDHAIHAAIRHNLTQLRQIIRNPNITEVTE